MPDRVIITIIATVVLLFVLGKFLPIGKLPGDIYIELGSGGIWIPLTSMLICSLIISLIMGLISRFFQ